MNWYFITFRSVTIAQRGEGAIRKAGIGYCLQLRQRDVGASLILLQENGITFSKIYRKEENGTVREVQRDLFG